MANTKSNFTWQTFFLVIIGICGVGGMMYYLFTDPDYDGNGGRGIDSTYIAKIVATDSENFSENDKSDKHRNKGKKSTKEDNKTLESKSALAATKPVEVKQTPKVEAKPIVVPQPKPQVPVVFLKPPIPIQQKPVVAVKPIVVAKPLVAAKTIVVAKPVVAAKPIVVPKPVVVAKATPVVVAKATPVSTPKPIQVKPQASIVASKSTVVSKPVVANKAIVASKPVQKTVVSTASSFVAKPYKKKEVSFKPSTKEDKVMSDNELQQLTANILKKGNEEGIYAKCVRLHNTTEGNNKSTLLQVEKYLQSQKFVIAGRETVPKHVKGYEVSAIEGCLLLTLGTF